MKKVIIFFLILFINTNTFADEAYFDLSEKEIQIQTVFIGKEIIIFGIFQPEENTILSIVGPEKDTRVLKKERLLGFWFNTKKMIYKKLPSLFFIAASSPIKEILNYESIIKSFPNSNWGKIIELLDDSILNFSRNINISLETYALIINVRSCLQGKSINRFHQQIGSEIQ